MRVISLLTAIHISTCLKCEDLYDNIDFHCNIHEESGTLRTHIGEMIFWKRFTSANYNPDLPALIGAHGGPGGNHVSMIPYKPIACTGRAVIIYDQAGAGSNTHYDPEKTPWIRDVQYYSREVDDVAVHFKLPSFHLIGQSWGGMISQNFVLDHLLGRAPFLPRVISATHTSIFLAADTYAEGQRHIINTYPLGIRKIIDRAIQSENFSDPEFEKVDDKLSGVHTMRTLTPECMNVPSGFNGALYVFMQGPSEFVTGGYLRNWDNRNKFSQRPDLKVPQMVFTGEYDSMHQVVMDEWIEEFDNAGLLSSSPTTDEFIRRKGSLHKNLKVGDGSDGVWAEVHVVPQAGHRTIVDNADFVLSHLKSFFEKSERFSNPSQNEEAIMRF
eukprot:GDKJ01050236.1.p1 GENE.GDKJ01050236.1~~GDKJ01050236.1.p1  ORF type:complete len:385 (-),score=56.93 GDKJ01050236.1:49-1203(-)